MGNFRSGGGSRGGFGGGRSGGRSGGFGGRGGDRGGSRGGFRDRDSGFDRGRPEMHSVTCDKCHKQCEVPFKPSGDKPVYCSDCFRKDGNSSGGSRSSGMSSEQFQELNTKLDKILAFLEQIEVEEEFEDEESEDDSEDEDEEAN